MKIEITNSQRMALCSILLEHARNPKSSEVFYDCSTHPAVETTPLELLTLFVEAAYQ